MKKIILIIVVVLIGVVLFLTRGVDMSFEFTNDSNSKLSECASKVHLMDLTSESFKNIQVENELLVLSFWATWCKACKEEMPHLIEFCKNHNIDLIHVSNDNSLSKDKVKEVLCKYGASEGYILSEDNGVLTVTKDRERIAKFMERIGSDYTTQPGYPYTLVLNKNKEILNEYRGKAEDGNYVDFFTEMILQY